MQPERDETPKLKPNNNETNKKIREFSNGSMMSMIQPDPEEDEYWEKAYIALKNKYNNNQILCNINYFKLRNSQAN